MFNAFAIIKFFQKHFQFSLFTHINAVKVHRRICSYWNKLSLTSGCKDRLRKWLPSCSASASWKLQSTLIAKNILSWKVVSNDYNYKIVLLMVAKKTWYKFNNVHRNGPIFKSKLHYFTIFLSTHLFHKSSCSLVMAYELILKPKMCQTFAAVFDYWVLMMEERRTPFPSSSSIYIGFNRIDEFASRNRFEIVLEWSDLLFSSFQDHRILLTTKSLNLERCYSLNFHSLTLIVSRF